MREIQGNRIYRYYDRDKLCTVIHADFTAQTIQIENFTDDIITRAFGVILEPNWDDFLSFLEDRCVPRSRCNLRRYLDQVGVVNYDPVEIVSKTQGRMAEDHQWISIEIPE